MKNFAELREKAMSIRDSMSQVTGYTGQSSEQNATANGISQISYEQARHGHALTDSF